MKDKIQRRLDKLDTVRNQMCADGYAETVKNISLIKANLLSFITSCPLAIVCIFIYFTVWDLNTLININIIRLVVSAVVLVILHEIIHGLTWAIFCKEKWKSIEFGFVFKYLSPYCHCSEVLNINKYRLGVVMPLIVTGIIPFIISLITGSFETMLLSVSLIGGAGGDLTVLLLLANEEKDTLVYDHPTNCGSILYKR